MGYSVSFEVDEARRRIHVSVSGPIESARYVDDCIAYFRGMESPWLYQKLVDFRASTGTVDYGDIIRLEQYWASTPQPSPPARTAAVLSPEVGLARNQSVKMIFESHPVVGFLTLEEAVAWLDAAG